MKCSRKFYSRQRSLKTLHLTSALLLASQWTLEKFISPGNILKNRRYKLPLSLSPQSDSSDWKYRIRRRSLFLPVGLIGNMLQIQIRKKSRTALSTRLNVCCICFRLIFSKSNRNHSDISLNGGNEFVWGSSVTRIL